MLMSILTTLNSRILSGEKQIKLDCKDEFETEKGFVCILDKSDLEIDFGGMQVKSGERFVEIKNSKNVVIKNLKLTSRANFAITIVNSENVLIESCELKAKSVCITSEKSTVCIKKSEFILGNGVCISGDSNVDVTLCNFGSGVGEGITVIDNSFGKVTAIENAFKKNFVALKSAGRNQIRFANNYCTCSKSAIEIIPSFFKDKMGAYHVEVEYNMFDETGEAVIVIEGNKNAKIHLLVQIHDNIFLGKNSPAIKANGVEKLSFKNNNVKTDKESEVVNSVINGIVC